MILYHIMLYFIIYDVLYRVTHGNLTYFEWVVLSRSAEGGNEVVGILFLWVGHFSSNGDLVSDHCSKHVSRHLISRFGDVPWPPRSPDLSTCDFFPLGVFEIACLHLQTAVR